jgi:23S rRNA pseudouridine2605 synthase
VSPADVPAERLQKVLASAGVASRRASEALIAAGRVTVDGRVANLGQQVDPAEAVIAVDGRPIGSAARATYLLLHKPAGVTSTTRDRHAASTVLDFVPTVLVPDGARLYPVGRLDQDSEGLLLLTNDGAWSERVLHPRFGVEREYALGLRLPLSDEQRIQLERGIRLDEGLATLQHLRPMTAVEVRGLAGVLDPTPDPRLAWYRATLRQGWKRQLRRMFGAVGSPVERLVRVRIGPVRIGELRSGRARALKLPEVRGLAGGGGRSRDPAPPRPRRESSTGRVSSAG